MGAKRKKLAADAVSAISLQGSTVNYSIAFISGSYKGTLSADGNSIVGTWTQGDHPLPLNLVRVTKDTAWDIPEPPTRTCPKPGCIQ